MTIMHWETHRAEHRQVELQAEMSMRLERRRCPHCGERGFATANRQASFDGSDAYKITWHCENQCWYDEPDAYLQAVRADSR